MLSLDECAERLSLDYLERAKFNKAIWQAGQDMALRERELRPEAGWPGKNDEARAAAKDTAMAADQAYQNAIGYRNTASHKLAELEAEIAGIEAQRRAAEWRIRERLVETLTQGGVDQQSRGDRMEAAVDDTLQREVDNALQSEAAERLSGVPIDESIEMPF